MLKSVKPFTLLLLTWAQAQDSCQTKDSVNISVEVSMLESKTFDPFEIRALDGYCISEELAYSASYLDGSAEVELPPWADFDTETMKLRLLPHSEEEEGKHTIILRGAASYAEKYYEAATYVNIEIDGSTLPQWKTSAADIQATIGESYSSKIPLMNRHEDNVDYEYEVTQMPENADFINLSYSQSSRRLKFSTDLETQLDEDQTGTFEIWYDLNAEEENFAGQFLGSSFLTYDFDKDFNNLFKVQITINHLEGTVLLEKELAEDADTKEKRLSLTYSQEVRVMTEDVDSLKKYFAIELLDKDYEAVTYGYTYRIETIDELGVSFYIEAEEEINNGEFAKVKVDANYGILTAEGVSPVERLKSHQVTVKLDYETSADEAIEDQYAELSGSSNVDECIQIKSLESSEITVKLGEVKVMNWPDFAAVFDGICHKYLWTTFTTSSTNYKPQMVQIQNSTEYGEDKLYIMPHSKPEIGTTLLTITIQNNEFSFVTYLKIIVEQTYYPTFREIYSPVFISIGSTKYLTLSSIENQMGADYSISMESGPEWISYKSSSRKFTFDVARDTSTIGDYHQVFLNWNAQYEAYTGGFFGTIQNNIDDFYQSYVVDIHIIDMIPDIDLEVGDVEPIKEEKVDETTNETTEIVTGIEITLRWSEEVEFDTVEFESLFLSNFDFSIKDQPELVYTISFIVMSNEYVKFSIASETTDFQNNELLVLQTKSSQLVYYVEKGKDTLKMGSQELEINLSTGESVVIDTDCTSELLSFGINPEISLGISEGLEFTWDDFQYPGEVIDCRKDWTYYAFLKEKDSEGVDQEVEIPLWIRFNPEERTLIVMPHAKTEQGTHYIVLVAEEGSEEEEPLVYETTIEIKVKSNTYPAFKESIEVQELVIGEKTTFSIPSIENEAGLEYELEYIDGPSWVSFSRSKQRFTFNSDEQDYFDGSLELGRYSVEMYWNAKSQTNYAGAYLGITAIEGTAAENFYQTTFIDLELVEMPAELKPQVKEIRNMTEYLEVELAWVYPVEYGDQLTYTVDTGRRRRLQESQAVELLGELFTFSMLEGSTLPLPSVSLGLIDDEQIILRINKSGGGQFTESDLINQNMVLSTIESYQVYVKDEPKQKLMASQITIDLDNYGKFEIIEECETKVSFGVEDQEVAVSTGKYIDFGNFYYKDSNGDCRMDFTYSGEMEDGSQLLSFFKVHEKKAVFEILPHAKNETGDYRVILQAREVSAGKSDLYFESIIDVKITESDYVQFYNSPSPYYITIGDTRSFTLPSIQNSLDMTYSLELVDGPSWITYQKGSKRFKIKTQLDSFLDGDFELGRYEVEMEWNARSTLEYAGSYTGVEVLNSNEDDFYQPYYFQVEVLDMEPMLFPQLKKVSNMTEYIQVDFEWGSKVLYRENLVIQEDLSTSGEESSSSNEEEEVNEPEPEEEEPEEEEPEEEEPEEEEPEEEEPVEEEPVEEEPAEEEPEEENEPAEEEENEVENSETENETKEGEEEETSESEENESEEESTETEGEGSERRLLQEKAENLKDLFIFSMKDGSSLTIPDIFLKSIDEDGFSLKLTPSTQGETYEYSDLIDQVLTLQTKESYKIHTEEAPIEKMMAKYIEIPLDDFKEYEVVSECVKNTEFNFQDTTLKVSEGKEFNFGEFREETEEGDCISNWEYSATLKDGTELPQFIRVYPGALIVMPHARTETGTYELRVTAKAVNVDLAYTDVLTVKIEDSYLAQFRKSMETIEVRVGDSITDSLPSIYNPNDMKYDFEVVSQPKWSSFKNNKFTYKPDLDDYLSGDLDLGTYEITLTWNAKSSQEFSGSFLGVQNLGANSEDFYQPYVFEVEIVDQTAELELQVQELKNKTEELELTLAFTQNVEYKETLIVARILQEQTTLLDDLFSFSMKEGSNIEVPEIEVKSYSNSGLVLGIKKANGEEYTFEELEDQVMLIQIKESYDITSIESPKTKLKAQTLEVKLDSFGSFEVITDCKENTSFNIEDQTLGVSEGLNLEFSRFMTEAEDDYCRINWTFTLSTSFGQSLPSFIRFDEDERKIAIMPHSKDQIGEYSLFLTAKETSEDYEEITVQESFKVKVEDSFLAAFKTTPGPVEVRVGDDITYKLPTIVNEAGMSYDLKTVSKPSWIKYSSSSRKFTLQPDLDDFLAGQLDLGEYEIEMDWNARSTQEYSGSFFGSDFLSQSADEDFYQPYFLKINLIDMPSGLYANLRQVSNQTDYLRVDIEWNSEVIYNSELIMGRMLQEENSSERLLQDMFQFQMKEGSSLSLPDISLRTYDEEGFQLELSQANGEPYEYDNLKDQVLLMTSQESYSIYSEESPRVKLITKEVEIALDNFDEYEYVSDCKNNTSFGFDLKYSLQISKGLDLKFDHFLADNLTDFECRTEWKYAATLEDGTPLPVFIRFFEEIRTLKVLPHAQNETGTYKVLLTATEEAEGKEKIEVKERVTFTFTSSQLPAFRTTPGPYEVRVGDRHTWELPKIENDGDVQYSLKKTSGPSWASYSSSKERFTFDADLDEFLDGELQLGDYVVEMDFNVKDNNQFTGSFLGSDVLAGDTSEFYQDYYLDVILIEMPADLEINLQNLENKTDYILASLQWSEPVEYRQELNKFYEDRRMLNELVFTKLFQFQMSTESSLSLPTITLEEYDEDGVTLRLTEPSSQPYVYEDVKNQVLQLKLDESYEIHSSESPRVKLKEQVLDIELDNFKEYELINECEENQSFGLKSEYKFGISEGLEHTFDRFMYDDNGECRFQWTYTAEMEDGSPLPVFIRFYPDTYTFYIMPHAKNETGTYKVLLEAENVLEGYETLRVRHTVTIQVTNNLFPAFKTSPGPHTVRVGDEKKFNLPTISNESDMRYKLRTVNNELDWASYSSKSFLFTPSLDLYEAGQLSLGEYEIEMNWNAEGDSSYTGSFFGVSALEGNADETFLQKYFLDIILIEMPDGLTFDYQNYSVKNVTERITFRVKWAEEVIFHKEKESDFTYKQNILDEYFTFTMAFNATLSLPKIDLIEMNSEYFDIELSKENGDTFLNAEFEGQILEITSVSTQYVYSKKSEREKLSVHTTQVPLFQVEYEEYDPSVECPTKDDLKSEKIVISKSEEAYLTIPSFQYFSSAGLNSDGKDNCVKDFTVSIEMKEVDEEMPLFMRRIEEDKLRIMPHADTEVGTYELEIKVTENSNLTTSITPREYSFFVDIQVKNSNLISFKKTPGPATAYIYSETEFSLPDIINSQSWDYELSQTSNAPEWSSYKKNKEAFIFYPSWEIEKELKEGEEGETISLLGSYEVYMDFNAQDSSYLGSYFGLPSTSGDSSSFNQDYILDVNVVDVEEGLALQKKSLDQYLKLEMEFNHTCREVHTEEDLNSLLDIELQNPPEGVNYKLTVGDLSCKGLTIEVNLTDSQDLASKYFEESKLVITQNKPTYQLMSSGITPPVKFSSTTIEVDLSDWAFDDDRVIDPESSCPTKLSLDYDTVSVKIGQDTRLDFGGFQYSPTDTKLISSESEIACNKNFTYSLLLDGEEDLGYFIRIEEGEKLWILPHSTTEKGTYEVSITAKEQPETEQSLTIVSNITVKITSSDLTQFIETPSPALAYQLSESSWSLPSIKNKLGLEYSLRVTEKPSWASYSTKSKKFTFDLSDQPEVQIGAKYEIWMDFNLESSSDTVGTYFGVPSNNKEAKYFNQQYVLEVQVLEAPDGLYLEKKAMNQYLKTELAFNQTCEQVSGKSLDLTEELMTISVENEPQGIVYELVTSELTCSGVVIQFKLEDSTLLAKDVFATSQLKIVGIQSDHLVAKNSNPVLKFASQELLLDLSDWKFNEDDELNPEEECPRNLKLEYDTVNVAVSKDKTVFIGGMQYTPQKEGDITNGIIDCRQDFNYTVAYNSSTSLPPFIRFDEETKKIWIIPHSRKEVGSYQLVITATELPESEESIWTENYLNINILDSQLTNFVSTPGPTFAYLNTEREFTLPKIENIVGLDYDLELESKSKYDWLSYSTRNRKLTFEPLSEEGIEVGDTFEVWFNFNAQQQASGGSSSYFGLPEAFKNTDGFNQIYILDVEILEVEPGIEVSHQSTKLNSDGSLSVTLSFSQPIKAELVNLDNFQDLLEFKISNPPDGMEWALRLISMNTSSLTFLIGEKTLVEFYPGVDTKIIPSSEVSEVPSEGRRRVLQEEEEGTTNSFSESIIELSVSESSQFVSNSDPPFTLFSQTINVPLLETEEEEEEPEEVIPVSCSNTTSVDENISLKVSEREDFTLPLYRVNLYNEEENTCEDITNSEPVYTLTYGVDKVEKFPQFLRYEEQEGSELPSLSIQPHSDEEIGVHVVNIQVEIEVLKEGEEVGSDSSSSYELKTYISILYVTVKSSQMPYFEETPGDEPYLVYLYNTQRYSLPDLENSNNIFIDIRLDSAYNTPDFLSFSRSKDRFTFDADSFDQVGPYEIYMKINAESEDYVGSYFAVSSGVNLDSFNEQFIFDIEVVDIEEGLELQKYSVPQSKEVTVYFNQDAEYKTSFNSETMQEIFDFKITNVSSSFDQSQMVYEYVKKTEEYFVFQVSSENGILLPDGCSEVDLLNECLDVNNWEVLELTVSPAKYDILADTTPPQKLSSQTFEIPLWVDPERIDPECPKTNEMEAQDKEFTLKLGEKREILIPQYQWRLAEEECAKDWSYQVYMSNSSALISSIRYYPEEDRRIDFIPHATNEVGEHKVTVLATLTSEIEANNQTQIEQEIVVTVEASDYPSVQSTVNKIDLEIYYDHTYTLPSIDNTGEYVYSLELENKPDFLTYDQELRQLIFEDMTPEDIKEDYLLEFNWNTETTVVKDEEGNSETKSADQFNQPYLIDLSVADVTGKLQVKAVTVEEEYVMGLELTYDSWINLDEEKDIMQVFEFEIVEGDEEQDYSALEVNFFNFTGDTLRIQASMGEGFLFENEEVLQITVPEATYFLLSKEQPGKKFIADSMNVTIGVLGKQEQEVEEEEEEEEKDSDKEKYLLELADQCKSLSDISTWLFYPPLALLFISLIISFFKKINLTFLWLWFQFIQIYSLALILQVGIPQCLIEEISFYSLLKQDPFGIRKLYKESQLKAPMMDNFAYHHIETLDFLYNGPVFVLGFCLLATIMIFIIFAALVMPSRSKGGHVASSFDSLKGNYIFRFASLVILPMMILAISALHDKDNTDSFMLGIFTMILLSLSVLFSVTRIPKYREIIMTNPMKVQGQVGMFIQDITVHKVNCHFYYSLFFFSRYLMAFSICFLTNSPSFQVAIFIGLQVLSLGYAAGIRPFFFPWLSVILGLGELLCMIEAIILAVYLNLATWSMSKIGLHTFLFWIFVGLAYLLAICALIHVILTQPQKHIQIKHTSENTIPEDGDKKVTNPKVQFQPSEEDNYKGSPQKGGDISKRDDIFEGGLTNQDDITRMDNVSNANLFGPPNDADQTMMAGGGEAKIGYTPIEIQQKERKIDLSAMFQGFDQRPTTKKTQVSQLHPDSVAQDMGNSGEAQDSFKPFAPKINKATTAQARVPKNILNNAGLHQLRQQTTAQAKTREIKAPMSYYQ